MNHSLPSTMRAISPVAWGPPDVLREIRLPIPDVGPGEVLVRVKAAGVNPTDWKSRATGGRKLWKDPPILGFDISGVVERVAEGSVLFKSGDEVFGMPLFPYQAGGYAEYVAAPARHFSLKPPNIDHVHAAALPLAGLTAWQALVDAASLKAKQKILVHAAAGGVGHLAVQIAKAKDAYVIGTAQRSKHEFVMSLGADEVIDYTEVNFADRLADIDVVLDPIGDDNGFRSVSVLKQGGILVSLIPGRHPATAEAAAEACVEHCMLLVEPDRVGLTALAQMVAAGRIRPHVSRVLNMTDAAEAHRMGEHGRTQGKLVLVP